MPRRATTAAAAVAVLCGSAHALDNTLGATPGMGWNSDYCIGCVLPPSGDGAAVGDGGRLGGLQNEAFVALIADSMHSMPVATAGNKTLQQLGYQYVNMDASWNLKTRSASGDLQPDPKLWPHGLNHSVAYVHSLGLGFGLYGDKGTKDCAGNPGQLGHEEHDAQWLAANEIDWWKEDSCATPSSRSSREQQVADYATMRDALNKTGRVIWYALCGWNPWYADPSLGAGNRLGNSWRSGPDTGSGWKAVMTNVEDALSTSQWYGVSVGPTENGGGWNDGSLLLNPDMGGVSQDQHRSQFSMWSMLAMNLLLTGNLSALDPYALETWSNELVIAVDQDSLGFPAILVESTPSTSNDGTGGQGYVQASVAECGGEPGAQKWVFDAPAAQFVSNNNSAGQQTCINVESCLEKPGHPIIYDGCTFEPAHGGCCDTWCNERFALEADGTLRTMLPNTTAAPDGWCVVTDKAGLLSAAPCDGTSPKWKYTAATGELATADGLCLTNGAAPGPGSYETAVMGRPLANGDFAVLLLNNKGVDPSAPQSDVLVCDQDCLQRLKSNTTAALRRAGREWPPTTGRRSGDDATLAFDIADLWQGGKRVAEGNTSVYATVARGGASAMFRLTPS